MTVNELIQTACEDLSLVGDGEQVAGELAASCEGCLNRAIADLNADNYISLSVKHYDVNVAGSVYFKKLGENEVADANVIDQEPPDAVQGVSRQVGMRWLALHPSNPQEMDRVITYSYPTLWSYQVDTEQAPSGKIRRVGKVLLNGQNPTQLRIYENSRLPTYKLASYREQTQIELTKAMKSIDTTTANNRPLTNGTEGIGDYMSPYYNLLGGLGL